MKGGHKEEDEVREVTESDGKDFKSGRFGKG